jgi:hypothetical protein
VWPTGLFFYKLKYIFKPLENIFKRTSRKTHVFIKQPFRGWSGEYVHLSIPPLRCVRLREYGLFFSHSRVKNCQKKIKKKPSQKPKQEPVRTFRGILSGSLKFLILLRYYQCNELSSPLRTSPNLPYLTSPNLTRPITVITAPSIE